jgi:hypothetical protein
MPTLKKLFVTTFFGEGLPVALQLKEEGVEVYASIIEDISDTVTRWEKPKKEEPEEKKKRLSLYDGIVEKVPISKWAEFVRKNASAEDSFLFFDFNSTWKWAERLAPLGIPGIYPTEEDRRMETDRDLAKEFIKKNYPDVEIAEEHEFSKVDEALKFIEGASDTFVAKGNNEDAPTFVPDTDDPGLANEELGKKLEEEREKYEKGGFLLEKRISRCKELTPQAWFVDGVLVGCSLDIELKRIGASDVGFMTGCSADLVFETDIEADINAVAFPKAVRDMAKRRKGIFVWDISLLYDPETGIAYGSEFCPNRPGYNAFFTELAHFGERRKFFENLMGGRNPYDGKDDNYAASVRLFNFRPTDGKMTVPEGKPVEAEGDSARHFWPMDVKEGEKGMESVGWDYQLGVVTGSGDSPKSAAKDAYENLSEIGFDDKIYRPVDDYLNEKYPGSVIARWRWGKERGLF